MGRTSPRQIPSVLLQLGGDASGQTLEPEGELSYNVEDLAFYFPSRRTRVSGSLTTITAAAGRRSLVEVAGIAGGGTWVEYLKNSSTKPVAMLMLDPSLGSQITNDLVDGWEFAATTFFDEVFLSGLYPISGDVLPWSQRTPRDSIVSVGTTTNVPVFPSRFLLPAGAAFPSPFWIPPNWLLMVIASVILDQINPIDYVLTLPPLGVTP